MKVTVSKEIAGREFSLTTGQIGKQASGCVVARYADTAVLTAAQTGPGRPGLDFFPLTVDYRERFAAAGKFAGGFLKREGRPTTKEILTARLTDRPIRPLFPKGFRDEVQVQGNVMSCDGENDPDVIFMTSASAALSISGMPFDGPIAGVRVGLIDDELILMPTVQQVKESTLDLIVAGSKESVLMIEGFADQLPEEQMADAIMFAHNAVVGLCELQEELAEKVGIEKVAYEAPPENPFYEKVKADFYDQLKAAKIDGSKSGRREQSGEVKAAAFAKYFPDDDVDETEDGLTRAQLGSAFYKLTACVVRDAILEGKRIDGRKPGDLRDVNCDVDMFPKVHGSALFTRGETQSLASVTLGTVRDQQRVDSLFGEDSHRFMLHYYFPSWSVGEVRPIRGPGRREIGHGCLAERSVAPLLPTADKFPYTIRVISDITESNGSSSMASVCSATMALMDAGVPIQQPAAGISIGLVKEGDSFTLLTDIMGDEDHFGDMDFKVAGTGRGVTGIQLDLKIDGINEEIIRATLEQAKDARKKLLRSMLGTLKRPRNDVNEAAPRLLQHKIDPEKIGLLIGPGGKTIRAIQDESGATIDVQEDGTVTVSGENKETAEAALARIEALTEDIQVGRVYTGKVSSVKDFGAFIEIAPGKDGLCHISELSDGFVKNVSDICKVGDTLEVKVIAVDDQNRVKLSRKVLLAASDSSDGDDDDGDIGFDD